MQHAAQHAMQCDAMKGALDDRRHDSSIKKLATRRRRVAHCVGLVTKSHSHPVFLGLLIAYLGQPVVDRLSRAGRSRTTGVLLVFLMVTIILCGLLLLALPQLFSELADLIQRAPAIVD